MAYSFIWFWLWIMGAAAAFSLGWWMSAKSSRRVLIVAMISVAFLIVWGLLRRFTAVLDNTIPASILAYLEGAVMLPPFMLIFGILWGRSASLRERGLGLAAMGIAAVVFMQGASWMVRPLPEAHALDNSASGDVLQSLSYTCVPAACATALNELGYPMTERAMARMTDTRAGRGATLVRAVDGLNQRLAGTTWRAHVAQPTYEQLLAQAAPMLVALRNRDFAQADHMVVVLEVHENWLYVFDPVVGRHVLSRDDYQRTASGKVIMFADTQLALAR